MSCFGTSGQGVGGGGRRLHLEEADGSGVGHDAHADLAGVQDDGQAVVPREPVPLASPLDDAVVPAHEH